MRMWIILLITLTVWGCRTVNESLSYYDACMSDDSCIESIMQDKALATSVVTKAVDATTMKSSSVGWIIGSLVGNIISFISGVSRGKRLMKGV